MRGFFAALRMTGVCGEAVVLVGGAAVVVDERFAPLGVGGEEDAGLAGFGVEAEGEVALAVELELAGADGDYAAGGVAAEGAGCGQGGDVALWLQARLAEESAEWRLVPADGWAERERSGALGGCGLRRC